MSEHEHEASPELPEPDQPEPPPQDPPEPPEWAVCKAPNRHVLQPGVTDTTIKERLKFVHKLLPMIRADKTPSSKDFEAIGAGSIPVRSGDTVKKIYDRFLSGELWGQWRSPREKKHQPIRVGRQLQDLRAKTPNISQRKCALALDIHRATLQGIYPIVEMLPRVSQVYFSRGNLWFEALYMYQFLLPLKDVIVEVFSLTHRGVVGALLRLAREGVAVTLLLDCKQAMSPYELPCVMELLDAKENEDLNIKVLVQKTTSTMAHQKVVVVDNVLATTASANPSMNGLTRSMENMTWHFLASEIDSILHRVQQDQKEAFREIDRKWVKEQLEQTTPAEQLSAAMASEGLMTEELQQLPLEMQRVREFMVETGNAVDAELRSDREKETKRRRYVEVTSARLCVNCGAQLSEKGVRCDECRETQNTKYQERKNNKVCRYCKGWKPPDKHFACATCRAKNQKDRRALVNSRAPGMCYVCLKEPCKVKQNGKGLYAACIQCHKKKMDYQREHAAERAAKKKERPWECILCTRRRKPDPDNPGKFFRQCATCIDNDKKRYAAKKREYECTL